MKKTPNQMDDCGMSLRTARRLKMRRRMTLLIVLSTYTAQEFVICVLLVAGGRGR